MSSYAAYLNGINTQLTVYFVIISSSIGLPSNLISAWLFVRIMKKSKNNNNNMGFLCLIQSVFEFVFLLVQLILLRSTPLIFSTNLSNTTDFSCKLLTFLRRFTPHASCGLMAFITIDRYLAVCFPNRFVFMRKKSSLALLILGIFIILALVNSPNLFFYLPPKRGSTCTANPQLRMITDLIAILFRTVIPFAVMILLDVLIIRKMRASSKLSSKQASFSQKEHDFTIAVLAYDVFFLITSLPITIYLIVNSFLAYSGVLKSDPVLAAGYSIFYGVVLNFSHCKQSLMFFMNIGFNKLFRREMFLLLRFRTMPSSSIQPLDLTNAQV